MTDIRQNIGFEATEAINSIARVAAELARYNSVIQQSANATRGYNQEGGRFDRVVAKNAASVRNLSNQIGAASTSAQKLQYLNQVTQQLRAAVQQPNQNLQQLGRTGQTSANQILLSWQSVIRLFKVQVIHQAVAQLTGAFRDSVQEAREFEIGLAEVQTIGNDLNLNLDELADKVHAVSEEFGQSSATITEGLYQTLSNQVVDASDSFDFLRTSAQFATAAVTDTGSAVNLLSSVVNAYGAAASETDDIAAKLFRTIELGRVRASELANTFGRVAVLSDQLGVSLDETLASIATLTVQGVRYNEAFTLITNTQLKLIRPSEQLKATFDEMGISSAEAGIQAFGFQGFLEQLTDTTDGTATAIGDLFNRVRAIRGVLGLTSDATERFQENLKLIGEADSSILDQAAQRVFDTEAKQFEIELTRLQNAFLSFGRGFIAVVNDVTGVFGGLLDTGKATFAALVAGGLTYVAFSQGPFLAAAYTQTTAMIGLTVATVGWTGAMTAAGTAALAALTSPVGLALAASAGVLLLASRWDDVSESAENASKTQVDAINAATDAARLAEEIRRRSTERAEGAILSATQRVLQQRQQLYRKDAENSRLLQEAVFGGLGDQISDRLSVFESFVGKLRDVAIDAKGRIDDLNRSLEGAKASVEDFNFDRSIRGLDPIQSAFAQIERSQNTIRQAQQALASGDFERAQALQQQAAQQARAALSTADQSDNIATIARAEQTVADALQQRVAIDERLLANQKRYQQQAREVVGAEEARNARLQIAIERFREFELISEGLVVNPKVNPDEARQELTALATFIQTELEDGAANAQLLEKFDPELSEVRKRLRDAFIDPVSGQQVTELSSLINLNFDRIIETLSQQARALSSDQKIALVDLIDVDFNDIAQQIRGFADAQNRLVQLPDAQDNAQKATDDLINKQGELQASLASVDAQTRVLLTRFVNVGRGGTESVGLLADVFNELSANFQTLTGGSEPAVLRLGGDVAALIRDVREISQQEIITDEQAAEASNKISQLQNIAKQLNDQGFDQIGGGLNSIARDLDNAFRAGNQLQALQEAAQPLQLIEQRVGNLGAAFTQVNSAAGSEFTAASSAGAQGFLNASTSVQTNLQEEIRLLQRRNGLQTQLGAGAATGRQFGGPLFRELGGPIFAKTLHRAAGGFARGTDNVLASLTAGESVNTVAATRRFFPQIQAMNANVIPQFRQDGGTVTQTGDFNITVNEAATPRETARAVMTDINRQVRRGTFNLRRK